MQVNKSLVLANKIVNIELFFSLLKKKLEFNIITKLQLRKILKINPKNEPSVLLSFKYFCSEKNKNNFLNSPVLKINTFLIVL